ncbi:hypothetical protein [Arcanobacterium canis]
MGVLLCSPTFEENILYALAERRTDHYVVRRCGDMTEILAAAQAGIGSAALIEGDLESLTLTAIRDLESLGLTVSLIGGKAPAHELRNLSEHLISPSEAVGWIESMGQKKREERSPLDMGNGCIVAVWGPPGSHGRSTLTRELARISKGVAIDLDLVAPSLAQICGVEESSALVAFSRNVEKGRDLVAAGQLLTETDACGTRIIAGVNSAQRWREISSPIVEKILHSLRRQEKWTFVDLAGGMSGTDSMRDRWQVSRNVVEAADIVLHVASASVIGMRRMLEHTDLNPPDERAIIVINRLRASSVGRNPSGQIRRLLAGVHGPIVTIRDDASRFDAALLKGRSVLGLYSKCGASKDIRYLWEQIRQQLSQVAIE